MELEMLFTASKWDILQKLAEQPLSPLELAERSSTSLANISQQLKLLEVAGLVTCERIRNRDKGLPRLKYRLAKDQGYFISTSSEFAEKKLCALTAHNKAILRIWFYGDAATKYVLEKAFWKLEPLLSKIERLGVKNVSPGKIKLLVQSSSLKDLPEFSLKDPAGKPVLFSFEFKNRFPDDAYVLYTG